MDKFDLHKKAKLYHLTKEELDFIDRYAKKIEVDPQRILVNKSLFNKIVELYNKEAFDPNRSFIDMIKQKLGFTNPLETMLRTTKEIAPATRAKFYVDNYTFAPIKLEKNKPDYLLWEVLSHRNMDLFNKGAEGFIVIDDKFGRSFKFASKILDTMKQNITSIRTPHSDNLILLQNRKYPRVAVDTEGYVQKISNEKTPLYKGLICNVSVGGVKLYIESSQTLFFKGDRLNVRFTLDGRKIEAIAKVVYSGNMSYYGLMFEEIDFQSKRTIETYISKNLHDLI